MSLFERPEVRIATKAGLVASAGLSGILSQTNLPVAIALFVLSVALGVVDHLLTQRLAPLVQERIAGIVESAYYYSGFTKEDDVRIALFVPCISQKDSLKQLGRYYPTNTRSTFRRRISTSKGIVGLCFRSRKRCLEFIKTEDSFKANMIEKWGFTESEAEKIKVRRAYLAIPILSGPEVAVGVMYVDSGKESTLNADVLDRLTNACIPLSRWLK